MIFCDNPECPCHIEIPHGKTDLCLSENQGNLATLGTKRHYTRHKYIFGPEASVLFFCNVCAGVINVLDEKEIEISVIHSANTDQAGDQSGSCHQKKPPD